MLVGVDAPASRCRCTSFSASSCRSSATTASPCRGRSRMSKSRRAPTRSPAAKGRDSLVGLLRRQEDARRARDSASRRSGVTSAAPRVGRARGGHADPPRRERRRRTRAPPRRTAFAERGREGAPTDAQVPAARRRGARPVRDGARRRRSPGRSAIIAPLDVEAQIGDNRFHYVLGDGRPLRFERRVAHAPRRREAAPRRDAGAAGTALAHAAARRRQRALSLVARARLTVARELQFHNFLANPNPTGRSTATYVYETAKRPPRRSR